MRNPAKTLAAAFVGAFGQRGIRQVRSDRIHAVPATQGRPLHGKTR